MIDEPDMRWPADGVVIGVCEAVGKGWMSVHDGASELERHLGPTCGACADLSRLSIRAVRIVERLVPRVRGQLLSDEQAAQLLDHDDPIEPDHAPQHLALLICSCLQLTTAGDLREGAKAMGQLFDHRLPP